MLKRALRALILLPLLFTGLSPAHAAGTIAYSLSQQLDQFGAPLTGCLLYTIQAGTTSTPQNSYKDTALTLAQPNPLVCDAAGRLPQFFLADGLIKVRLTDKFGNPQVVTDNILVIGPSSGGGGGGSIDPTTIFATGDVKQSYGTQTITGWVRFNGRTIGSAGSGATERANADAQALFQYLWSTDTNLAVVGGRGASSIADWTANKQLTLPDGRGRVLAGLDDMGNTQAFRLTGGFFGSAITLGGVGGAETETLTLSQLPTGITSSNSALVLPNSGFVSASASLQNLSTNSGGAIGFEAGQSNGIQVNTTMNVTTTSNNTGGAAHIIVQPTMVVTTYIKL